MNNKIEKSYIYTGLGFPIELHNVEMIKINGELHPKIDVRKVADAAMEFLITQQTRFTGNQVKFIRTYFSMSFRDFAKVVNESHTAIKKWENFADNVTTMDLNIEIMLRLYICDYIIKLNKQNKNEFYNQYRKVTAIFQQARPLIKTNTYLSETRPRKRLITHSARTSCIAENIKASKSSNINTNAPHREKRAYAAKK